MLPDICQTLLAATARPIESGSRTATIKITNTDDMSILIDHETDLSGATWTAAVDETDGTSTVITVVDTDLGAGQITITMTDTLLSAISEDTHKWYIDRTNAGEQRRYWAGNFETTKYNV